MSKTKSGPGTANTISLPELKITFKPGSLKTESIFDTLAGEPWESCLWNELDCWMCACEFVLHVGNEKQRIHLGLAGYDESYDSGMLFLNLSRVPTLGYGCGVILATDLELPGFGSTRKEVLAWIGEMVELANECLRDTAPALVALFSGVSAKG